MKTSKYIVIMLMCLVVIAGVAGSGCTPEQNNEPHSAAIKAKAEVTVKSVGLGGRAKSIGKDGRGRYWFADHSTSVRWMYDPLKAQVYRATKEEDGKWFFWQESDVTTESLGLGPDVIGLGRDPKGRYWFKSVGSSDRMVYNTESKQFRRAVQDESGEWKVGGEIIP